MGRIATQPIERFKMYVSINPENSCWEWSGYTDKDGYAYFWDGKTNVRAHIWSYKFHGGEIPEGLTLDHKCRTKACVNPLHLEPVTNQENIKRAKDSITHCRHGHPLSGSNLYRNPIGFRGCRICRAASDLKRKQKKLVKEKS